MRPISRDRADLADWREAAAAGGLSLSTSLARALFPKGTQCALLAAHTLAGGATLARFGVVPYLSLLRTNDNLATAAVDESDRAQDGDDASHVTMSSFPTLANGGFLLVGGIRKFRGVFVDMDAAVNSNASVLTVKYRKSDDTWADISATDGTAAAGATFGQDGSVTWTVPTDWKRASLMDIADLKAAALAKIPSVHIHESMFWTRWEVSAALDASVLVDAMIALAQSTAYADLIAGQVLELFVRYGITGQAGVEAVTDAGTGKLNVNVAAGSGGFD